MKLHAETTSPLAASLAEDDRGAGVPLLPWSLVGVGLFVAWLSCTHLRGGFVFVGADTRPGVLADYLMRVGDIGTLLLATVFAGRLGPLSSRPRLCAALVAAGALGTAAAPLCVGAGWPSAALAVASLCAGVGGAVLLLLWAEVYSALSPMRCLVFGAVSCIAAGVLVFFTHAMSQEASCLAITLLPLASGALAAVSLSRLTGEDAGQAAREARRQGAAAPQAPAGRASYPVPWKLVLLMALAGFASGFAGSILMDDDAAGAVHRIEATALFGAVMLGALCLRRGSFDVRLVAWVTLPLAVVSFVLIPVTPPEAGTLVSFLVKLSYVAFTLFVLIMLANVCYRHAIPSMRVFASARAASEGAIFAGIALRRWMQASGALNDVGMLWAVAVVGLVVTMGCVLLWHTERSVTSDWGAAGIDPASGAHVKNPRELLLERVEALTRECGLTPREAEVLALVAQGRDYASAEAELFMSHNTLKTHLHHIFAKTGTHGRDELLALVGTGEAETPGNQARADRQP